MRVGVAGVVSLLLCCTGEIVSPHRAPVPESHVPAEAPDVRPYDAPAPVTVVALWPGPCLITQGEACANQNCGWAPGCNAMFSCGTCGGPETCGGGGVMNVCGCTRRTCHPMECDTVEDGCGGKIDCGVCTHHFAKLGASAYGTCAIADDETLWCWGAPWGVSAPRQESTDRWASVDAYCAIRGDGTLWCPAGAGGQVGDAGDWLVTSTGENIGAPGLRPRTCGIRSGGTLWCWGERLPRDDVRDSTEPMQIEPQTTWASISVGPDTTCGISAAGAMRCWWNVAFFRNPQQDYPEYRLVRGDIAGAWKTVELGGNAICGIRRDDSLWCWRADEPPAVSASVVTLPASAQVSGAWSRVAVSNSSYCGVQLDGSLWCWGASHFGEVGDGTALPREAPVRIDGSALDVVAGMNHFCAQHRDGSTWCWGSNHDGQLGIGTLPNVLNAEIDSTTPFIDVATGKEPDTHFFGIRADGTLWFWGRSWFGNEVGLPVQIGGTSMWFDVATVGQTACARRTDGTLWCWRVDDRMPLQVGTDADWKRVQSNCALKTNGTLWCWTADATFNTGIAGPPGQVATPLPLVDFATGWGLYGIDVEHRLWAFSGGPPQQIDGTWSAVCSGRTSCAIASDGAVWCWRGGTFTMHRVNLPLAAWKLGCGVGECAVLVDGTQWCWDDNPSSKQGQAGYGTIAAPAQIGTATDWTAVDQGSQTNGCALRGVGRLFCSGSGPHGDGSFSRPAPVQISR